MAQSERLEELYKYFRSARDEVHIDIDCDGEYEPGHAQLSHDPVLNALAQLGVHRLGCERAFVSLIDNENQYVVAEVTKSVSLYNGGYHPADGGLAIGVKVMDLVSGVCPGTMPAFTDLTYQTSSPSIIANANSFVIPDFTLESEYKAKPYVTAFPFMRFYTGVPIRSDAGHVIGTYSVMDNKPRKGIDEQDLLVLTEIASSIMRHLELLKTQTSHDSALSLLRSLKSFVKGSNTSAGTADTRSGVQKQSLPMETGNPVGPESRSTDQAPPDTARHESSNASTGNESYAPNGASASQNRSVEFASPFAKPIQPESSTGVKTSPDNMVNGASVTSAKQRSVQGSEASAASSWYGALLERASSSIRAAMQMDEVIFVDAPSSTSSFPERNIASKTNAPTSANKSTRFTTRNQEQVADLPQRGHCRIPRSNGSHPSSHIPLGDAAHLTPNEQHRISEDLHNSLLSQFPGGCFFNFPSKETEDDPTVPPSADHTDAPSTDRTSSAYVPGGGEQNHQKHLESAAHLAFPLAKSMMFLPLFSLENRDCPFSIIAWSSEKRRIIQQEDFSYLGLFGVAIEAEFARILSAIQNRAKSDFISSISHELRSPLHGILGNVELLLDSDVGQEQRQMAEMIEKCGRSLLSTMDHILTYSKINSSTKDRRPSIHGIGNNEAEAASIDLSAVIEDSVDTLMTGNHFRALSSKQGVSSGSKSLVMSYERPTRSKDTQQEPGPLVNLTIDHCPSWYVATDAPVWARCVMNVLGNALKYTESGIIEVKLHLAPPPTDESGEHMKTAILSISDTGRGISSDYLRSHLFQPFLQENASSNGLGLGLSIVKKMIDGLNGSINVQSTLGKGTTVEISVPLAVESSMEQGDHSNLHYPGRNICFVGKTQRRGAPEPDSHLPSRGENGAALCSALSVYCRQWFGMEVSHAATLEDAEADVVAIFDKELELFQNGTINDKYQGSHYPRRALIIVPTASSTNTRPHSTKTDGVFHLIPPFGPRRLAATLKQALDYTDRLKNGITTSEKPAVEAVLPLRTKSQEAEPNQNGVVVAPNEAPVEEHQPEAHPSVMTLIVDDNEVNVKLLEKCLKRWGMAYKTAFDGAQAVDIFKNSGYTFDYVLMDISMPVMNGIEATRAIRNLEAAQNSHPRARIIAMTGLGNERNRQEALASGMDVFLTKPIRLRDVKTLLEVG